MKILNKLYGWYGRKKVLSILLIVILLLFFGFSSKNNFSSIENEDLATKNTLNKSTVKVTTLAKISNPAQVSLIGTVRAINEVDITPDRSGRVTVVNTALGQKVSAGQVIVQLENSSERASLLQAEGAYEAALASSGQSEVGVREAEIALTGSLQKLKNINQDAYNNINNVFLRDIDVFFSNPNSSIPGLRIGGIGNTLFLNDERKAFQTILPEWKQFLVGEKSLEEELVMTDQARVYTKRTLDIINIMIPLLSDRRSVDGFSDVEINNFRQHLTSAQTQTTATISSIDNAKTNLISAMENLNRVKLGASGSDNSLSDAQIKQALGTLRSAQANYEKTILRSPINGTVNSLDVKVGAFINQSQPIAKIANNSKSEIVTFVSDQEKTGLAIGDKVAINNDTSGTVAVIAPALDENTKKTEVRIALIDDSKLTIGDTVRIIKTADKVEISTNDIFVPLTALKFEGEDAYLFLVEENILVRKEVTIGEIRGGFVKLVSDLDINTEFVTDVRGKNVGDKVEVIIN